MRKVVTLLLLLLLPSALMAQGALKISAVYGPVEWKATTARSFTALTPSTPIVQIGDELRTGPGGTVTLELPDGSYMVVTENSRLTVQDFWSPGLKSMINLMLGKARFYIQRFGGKPNPYRVTTPTALIAVRGTTFEITVDDSLMTEVRCLEGRVAVETVGLPDREVILDQDWKTLVRPGEYPITPVRNDIAIARNRVIAVVKKSGPQDQNGSAGVPSVDVFARDNDRRNRAADPVFGSSGTNTDVLRGKPTLKWPNNR